MKEHPVIFSAESVKAILDGRKTQTRRVIKPQPPINAVMKEHSGVKGYWIPFTDDGRLMNSAQGSRKNDCGWYCPYGQVGDRLWVREAWWQDSEGDIYYKADWRTNPRNGSWKPSIHMFRKDSRITLEITEVRVERLTEITEEDAKAEGCPKLFLTGKDGKPFDTVMPTFWFEELWDSLNAKYGWETSPWVWVISFKVVE